MEKRILGERDELLSHLLKILSVIGLAAYIPSLVAAIDDRVWLVVAVDSAAYAVIVVLAYVVRVKTETKLFVVVATSLLLGATLIAVTGPLGAGHIWLMLAVILSSLFGRNREVAATVVLAMAVMAGWGAALLLGFDGHGMDPVMVGLNAVSLLVACLVLTTMIQKLLAGLSKSLAESASLAERLAIGLRESDEIRQRLQENLAKEDALLRELHHRVRNNLQIVLSLLSSNNESEQRDDSSSAVARRRIRALAAVNDVFLSTPAGESFDAYDVVRSVIQYTIPIIVEGVESKGHSALGDLCLGPNIAAVVAVLLSDVMAGIPETGIETSLLIRRVDSAIRVEIFAVSGDDRAVFKTVCSDLSANRIALGASPEVTFGFLEGSDSAAAGVYLSIIAD